MNYFPRNPPKRTIRGVSNDTDRIQYIPGCKNYLNIYIRSERTVGTDLRLKREIKVRQMLD